MKLKFEKIGSRPSKLVSLHLFHSLINHISHIEMSLIAENLNIDQNKFQAILIHPAIPQGVEAESFWKPKAKSFPTLLSCPLIITSKAEIGWVHREWKIIPDDPHEASRICIVHQLFIHS